MDIKLYGKKEDFAKIGKESAICLANHRSDVDWLIGYTLADRAGVLAVNSFYGHKIQFRALRILLKISFFIDSNKTEF